jgi:hypothetical protein
MGSTAESRFDREPREQDFAENGSHQFPIIKRLKFLCFLALFLSGASEDDEFQAPYHVRYLEKVATFFA